MDFGRLIALLNLSTSDNDNEALSAIRHANKLMKKHELQWENVVGSGKSYTAPPPPKPPPPGSKTAWTGGMAPKEFDRDFIIAAYKSTKFHEFMAKRGPSTQKFMLSLHSQFMKWGKLSPKQFEIFSSIWDEFMRETL